MAFGIRDWHRSVYTRDSPVLVIYGFGTLGYVKKTGGG